MGWGGRILVTRCHGGDRVLRSRAGCGAPRARDVESRGAGEVQRGLWGCSGDRLREGMRARGGSGGEVGFAP
jgi:hypothetical protein